MDDESGWEFDYEDEDFMDEEYYHGDDHEQFIPVRDGASIFEIYNECLEPTVFSVFEQMVWLLCSCLIFRILVLLCLYGRMPIFMCHVASIVCGVTGLFSLVGSNAIYTIVIATSSYWCVLFCARKPVGDASIKVTFAALLIYMVMREYVDILPESWEQVRGIHMIMVLKILSVCSDVSTKQLKTPPPFVDYLGYIFCPANMAFGPWIPISVYMRLFEPKKLTIGWIVEIFATGLRALLCLGMSSCILYWIFLGTSSSWLLAARDALSVRFSHYFVSYSSEVTILLSGLHMDLFTQVTTLTKIEMPRSLVEVVVHWNMPMHRWLKNYIFRKAAHRGPFQAVFLTFLASSMLHGMNFGLTVVLLSLGIYTYVEHGLREKLASVFDACIRSRKCPLNCQHKYTSDQIMVSFVNFAFGVWAYFHLVYLGVMMDRTHADDYQDLGILDSMLRDLQKWKNLGYASHYAMGVVYIGTVVI